MSPKSLCYQSKAGKIILHFVEFIVKAEVVPKCFLEVVKPLRLLTFWVPHIVTASQNPPVTTAVSSLHSDCL
jgi:hypothetical protein